MKVTVIGYRPYAMQNDDGTSNKGISLYVAQADPTDTTVRGALGAKYTIRSNLPAYELLMKHNFTRPFEADLDVYVSPAGKTKVVDMQFKQ